MSDVILEKDSALVFPHFLVLKASAGSGKTHALTERFVQFLLSEQIPNSGLENLLAITFSNNAAQEMKERVLSWLKGLTLGDPVRLQEISQVVSLSRDQLRRKAGSAIEEILTRYSDFRVKTIDSFMASVYRASAVDLGYPPDFEIQMSADALSAYAFDLYLRGIKERSGRAELLERVVEEIVELREGDAAYPWDPSRVLLREMKELQDKLSGVPERVSAGEHKEAMEEAKESIARLAERLEGMIEESGLERNKSSAPPKIRRAIQDDRYADLVGIGLQRPPVNKPTGKGKVGLYEQIVQMWSELGEAVRGYVSAYARSYYTPYLMVYGAFQETLERVKRQEGAIFVGDLNRKLAEYLDREMVPDIYFRLGEVIYHYLIDEFQDTSPLQWKNLFPLIENSLSQGGSLFVVGDTKQAIYGFRDADYHIMKRLEVENDFPSARHEVRELTTNHRSGRGIVDFHKRIFQGALPDREEYREAGSRSGLLDFRQEAKAEDAGKGYVEILLLDKGGEDDAPEKEKVGDLIEGLRARDYRYSDIAVLTSRNATVKQVSTWLNEKDIPFISYSTLDVRARRLTQEVVALLTFLDAPPDDLAFATFLLGDIFRRSLQRQPGHPTHRRLQTLLFAQRNDRPLYKAFQREFPDLWAIHFQGLFERVGYLPVYDLVSEIYQAFEIYPCFAEEEAALAKILETIQAFEDSGKNNLRDFLKIASEEEGGEAEWNIDVPRDIDAVKVMTIHKAKGLGFPVVIALLYGERWRGTKYGLIRDGEEAHLVKLTGDTREADTSLEEAYREEQTKDRVSRLNMLYVGFTRAERELYIIGVRKEKGDGQRFPLDLLPADEFPPRPQEILVEREAPLPRSPYPISHPGRPLQTPAGSRGVLHREEKRRGEFIHRVLSAIDFLTPDLEGRVEGMVQDANRAMGTSYPAGSLVETLVRFLDHEELRGYFLPLPGRLVQREREFCDREGHLLRMDRVVIDPDRVTVIDYKTGGETGSEMEDVAQLRRYMRILAGIHPGKEIEGLLAYFDTGQIRRVR